MTFYFVSKKIRFSFLNKITKKYFLKVLPAINPSSTNFFFFFFFFVAFDERIPNMPSQTCENAYFLKKTRFSEKLKIDLKS
jgi:hypothetical protein